MFGQSILSQLLQNHVYMLQANLTLTSEHYELPIANTRSTQSSKMEATITTKTDNTTLKILSFYLMRIISPSSTKNKKLLLR
jgi:hypothetical protein